MVVSYLRSSLYGTYNLCQHKAFLSYVLGFEEDTGKSAAMGSVFHKTLEHIAKAKKKYQETGENGGWDIGDEYIGEFIPDNIFDNSIISPLTTLSFEYYKSITPKLKWSSSDLVTIIGWVRNSLNDNMGMHDPRNKYIIEPEKYFDIEIKEDWAKYDYQIGDKRITGNLALKGTIDLVSKIDEDHYEILDYKSGKYRTDFATGEEKDYKKLQSDPQLLMYYYACRHIFPDIKYFDFTIYFVNAGGPFTLCYDDSSFAEAEELIKNRFLEMKANQNPELLSPTRVMREKKDYRCYNCCSFQKYKWKDSGLSICKYFQSEIKDKGLDAVTAEHCDWNKFGAYGDGGGRSDKKE